ncbi:putative acetyltransferase [Burkholderiales bacterium JOSHI_001]|nr:putative acetyltransferase [Burkholderiales bacterium JOSHI_001]
MPKVQFSQAVPEDLDALVNIRVTAMRESLESIDRFDPVRAKERFANTYDPACTRKIIHRNELVGFVVTKKTEGALLLDHLYVLPESQGQGIGAQVLSIVFNEADALGLPVRVGALRGSRSNNFYARHGFRLVEQAEFDNYYLRAQSVA